MTSKNIHWRENSPWEAQWSASSLIGHKLPSSTRSRGILLLLLLLRHCYYYCWTIEGLRITQRLLIHFTIEEQQRRRVWLEIWSHTGLWSPGRADEGWGIPGRLEPFLSGVRRRVKFEKILRHLWSHQHACVVAVPFYYQECYLMYILHVNIGGFHIEG